MVTTVVVLFLIATVIFAVSQLVAQGGKTVIDGRRENDTTAAFFAAESGLEVALASVTAAAKAGSYSDATCTALTSPTFSWANVTLTGASNPPSCSIAGATACTSCTVTSTAQVRQGTRQLILEMPLTVKNGVTCNGAFTNCANTPTVTWQLNLKNTAAVAGIGIFNLTYIGHGNNTPNCAAGSNCRLELDVGSPSNGQNSTGLMGNAVLIPAGATYPIYQTMTQPQRDLAEVGVFFYGTSAPTLTGQNSNPGSAAFWDDNRNSSTNTVGASGASTGATNDGTLHANGDTCNAPSSANQRTCQSWCYGGDTLVYLFSGNVLTLSDQLTGVTFGNGAQSKAMTRITKFPTTAEAGAPTDLDAEIWAARNPNFAGASPIATQVSSYKGRSTTGATSASVGAQWSSNGDGTRLSTPGGIPTLTVGTGFNTYPNQIISPGDSIAQNPGGSGSGTQSCTATCGTIVAQLTSTEAGGALGGRGTYQVSVAQNVVDDARRTWTISSKVLRVHGCTICDFENGDALSGAVTGRTINGPQQPLLNTYGRTEATAGVGRYPISGAPLFVAASTNALYAGTPGTTLYLNGASPQPPAAALLPMMIKITSGAGTLVPGTQVTSSIAANTATTAMTVSAAPTTPLDLANVCGGICALFVTNGTTPFSLSGINANFNEWASGFMCLKGVDLPPQVVTSSSATRTRWIEVVQ